MSSFWWLLATRSHLGLHLDALTTLTNIANDQSIEYYHDDDRDENTQHIIDIEKNAIGETKKSITSAVSDFISDCSMHAENRTGTCSTKYEIASRFQRTQSSNRFVRWCHHPTINGNQTNEISSEKQEKMCHIVAPFAIHEWCCFSIESNDER